MVHALGLRSAVYNNYATYRSTVRISVVFSGFRSIVFPGIVTIILQCGWAPTVQVLQGNA